MKITALETYFLSCPLPQPVRTSTVAISQVSEVIVQLRTDAGLVGIGEAHGPFLFRQSAEGLHTVYPLWPAHHGHRRSGGLTTWRKAAVLAELYHIPMAAHHDPQIHVHALAASPTGFILESFADPARDPLWFELFSQRPQIVDGFMGLPDAPGLGLELRQDTLEKYGVKIA